MSGELFTNQCAFYQLIDDENNEVSSESGSVTSSDAEPETLSSESDEFDAEESDEQTEAENYNVSGRVWKRFVCPDGETNVLQNLSRNASLTEKSKGVETIADCFNLFFDEQMIESIVFHTNEKAQGSVKPEKTWEPMDRIELNAFFGLLLLIGRFRESREKKHDLWRESAALRRSVYTAAMSRNRFEEILRYICFDEQSTREQRKASDKLAPLRQITETFAKNCQECYEATEIGTIDEQLIAFRGRCPFKVCVPRKFGRHGIKIWCLCDARTFYCCNVEIYLGKGGSAFEKQQRQQVVRRLTDFWRNSERAITIGNSFTDIGLAEELLANELYLVGTMRKNKTDLPNVLLRTKDCRVHSSQFLFADKLTLLSYVPEPQKCVVLLSTLHQGPDSILSTLDPKMNYKPEIIQYYNNTKNSVDMLDKVLREYSSRRCTRRWPFALFMHFLDIAAYNAFVLWIIKNPTWERNSSIKTKRKLFLEQLSNALIADNIDRRARQFEGNEVTFHKHVIDAIEATGRKITKEVSKTERLKRGRCFLCISGDNKYRIRCTICDNCICNAHSTRSTTVFCNRCQENK